MTNLERVEIIGILLHDRCKDKEAAKSDYKLLTFCEWTEEIREVLNSVSVDRNRGHYVLGDDVIASLEEMDAKEQIRKDETDINIEDLFRPLQKMQDAGFPKNLKLYKASFGNDSKQEFVRFANRDTLTVIFNSDKCTDSEGLSECIDHCLSSLVQGLDVFGSFEAKRNDLLGKTKPIEKYDDAEKDLKTLTALCALHAKFQVDKRPKLGSNHDIWNELLQNANDHIPGGKTSEERKLIIRVGEDFLELEYPDAGFSVRDFFAVCTSGNSGNEVSGENREGHKGTGFKSVYNLFRKVTITSHEMECVLEDVKKEIMIKGQEVVVNSVQSENDSPETYYPIPEFNKAENIGKTRIRLEGLKTGKSYSDILNMIFGEVESDNQSQPLLQRFINQKTFFFLNRIATFEFVVNGDGFSFDREQYIEKNYFSFNQSIEPDNGSESKNSRWNGKVCPQEKKKISVLFPKEYLEEDEVRDSEKAVYCTLPIGNFKLKTPFYINIPLLELGDDRKSLQDSLQEWNKEVLREALYGIAKLLDEHKGEPEKGKENLALNLTNLYRYFPYEYLKTDVYKGLSVSDELKNVSFLRTFDGTNINARSLSEMSNHPLCLPDYMYWWFGKQGGTDGFCCEKEFLYYDGIAVQGEKDDEKVVGGHKILTDKLRAVSVLLSTVDCRSDIENYMLRKAEALSLNLTGASQELDERHDTIVSGDFGQLLRKIYYASFIYSDIRKVVFKAFLLYCLGESLQNKSFHCLNVDWNASKVEENAIELPGYINAGPMIRLLREHFAMQFGLFSTEEIDYLKSVFHNLLESPYVVYERNQTDGIRRSLRECPRDIIGNLKGLDAGKDILESETKRLLSNEQLVIENREVLTSWINAGDILYGRDLNKNIIPYTSTVYYSVVIGNLSNEEYNNRVIKQDIYFCEAAKELLGQRYLDTGIKRREFYQNLNTNDMSFAVAVLTAFASTEAYKNEWGTISETVADYLAEENESTEKVAVLFKYILRADVRCGRKTKWRVGFKQFIPFCMQEDLDNAGIVFERQSIQPIGAELKQRFNDKVSDSTKEKSFCIWGGNNSEIQKFLLKEIVESRIFYVTGCQTARRHLYCRAKMGEADIIVLFSEESFGTVLWELYDCREYSEARPYKAMDCLPSNLLTGWRNYSIDESEFGEIKENVSSIWTEMKDDKDLMLARLITPYYFRTSSQLIEARGYGGEGVEEKRCPVCGSVLLAEQSVLNIKDVSYRPSEESLINLPLLLCKNCSESYRYANDVRWKPEAEVSLAEALELYGINNEEIKEAEISFEFPNATKVRKVKLTYLLRVIWWIILLESK